MAAYRCGVAPAWPTAAAANSTTPRVAPRAGRGVQAVCSAPAAASGPSPLQRGVDSVPTVTVTVSSPGSAPAPPLTARRRSRYRPRQGGAVTARWSAALGPTTLRPRRRQVQGEGVAGDGAGAARRLVDRGGLRRAGRLLGLLARTRCSRGPHRSPRPAEASARARAGAVAGHPRRGDNRVTATGLDSPRRLASPLWERRSEAAR